MPIRLDPFLASFLASFIPSQVARVRFIEEDHRRLVLHELRFSPAARKRILLVRIWLSRVGKDFLAQPGVFAR